jgi:hypothetical protein
MESCESLYAQGVRGFFFLTPETYWDGTPASVSDIQSIEKIFSKVSGWTGVRAKVLQVNPKMYPAPTYLETEGKIRNFGMEYLSQREHILIVEADEWWRPGTLKRLDDFITASGATTVSLRSIPVAGFPGYPLIAEQEGLLVYVKATERFKSGRCPNIIPKTLQDYFGIYHFTSTRRTMVETIYKHEKSSHYDDPNYAMDKWLKEKLPKIKPGEKDCHMFKKYQIWKEARHFSEIEWYEILPDSLKPFLGKPGQ